MTTNYSLYLYTPTSTLLKVITNYTSLHYVRSVNQVGTLVFTISRSLIDSTFLKKDGRLEIWRSLSSSSEYLETKTQWFIRNIQYDVDAQLYTITALSALCLLDRRIIAYDSGTSYSDKFGYPATLIQLYVIENLGSSTTDTARNWSNFISVPTPTLDTFSFTQWQQSRKSLLSTIQDIAQDSAQNDAPLFFDLEYDPGSKLFTFLTFTQQRGIDHSTGQSIITLSPEFGNLAEVTIEDDYTNEITQVYVGGKGLGADISITSASDSTRINESPFGRIETFVSTQSTNSAYAIPALATQTLREGRPRRIVSGRIINRAGTEYGVNWNWGDRIKVQIDEQVYTARIDTIEVDISGGKETINAQIRIE